MYSELALSRENVDQDSVYRHVKMYPILMLLMSAVNRIQGNIMLCAIPSCHSQQYRLVLLFCVANFSTILP